MLSVLFRVLHVYLGFRMLFRSQRMLGFSPFYLGLYVFNLGFSPFYLGLYAFYLGFNLFYLGFRFFI